MMRPAAWVKDVDGVVVGVKRMGAHARRRWDRENACKTCGAEKPGKHSAECPLIDRALRPILLLGLVKVLLAVVGRRVG